MTGGNSYHYGDNVTVNGTQNVGIIKYQSPPVQDALRDLLPRIEELRAHLTPESTRVLDEALPVLAAETGAPAQRQRALIAVATIAAAVGALGQPVVDAVNGILALLGAG
jgi:hypothetical protein